MAFRLQRIGATLARAPRSAMRAGLVAARAPAYFQKHNSHKAVARQNFRPNQLQRSHFHTQTLASGSVVIPVPSLGDSITEGTIVEWTKEVGDFVEEDEVVCILETDKVSVDIRATTSGVVTKLLAEEGDTVEVGADLVDVDPDAKGESSKKEPKAEESTEAPEKPAEKKSEDKSAAKKEEKKAPEKSAKSSGSAPAPTPAAPGSRNEQRVPMTRMRLRIAERLKEAQNVNAMLTTFNEIDMSAIMDLRTKYKEEFEKVHGVKLGFMSAFVKASTAALQAQPEVNAVIDGKDIVYRDYVDISIAVGTPTGLVVPVLRNCEQMGFSDVESNIAALGQKARKGQIAIEDMLGGTFTISNGGVYGSLMGTPIINPPQSAILGMHGIFKRPVVVNNEITIRPMMYVALTYDHRIIDGAGAVTFLKRIKNAVEDPARLLLKV